MANVFRSVLASARAILQSKTVTAGTSSQTVTPDSGYDGFESVTVNPTPTETKSDTPNVSTNKTVSPSSGKHLSQVTIQPLTHSGTYTPAANTAQNDMGAYHDKRYVNTSGMIVPSGAKSITANGTGIDVSSYATANVNVPNPTLSGNATAADVKSGKTFYGSNYTKQTGTYVEPTINAITPSNSSPVSMTADNNYKPSANGYAISSYTNVNLTAYGQQVRIGGGIYKVTVNPEEMTSAYVVGGSIGDVTPTADGEYFSSGVKNMTRPGWAYSQQPAEPIDFGAPITSGYASVAAKKTYTVTLPSGWRFIALIATRSDSANRFLYIFDHENNVGQKRTDTSTHSIAELTSSSFTEPVTDTSITFGVFSSSYNYSISWVAF